MAVLAAIRRGISSEQFGDVAQVSSTQEELLIGAGGLQQSRNYEPVIKLQHRLLRQPPRETMRSSEHKSITVSTSPTHQEFQDAR